MPIYVVHNDIENMETNAIVMKANHFPVVGSGVDKKVYEKAGYNLLLDARKAIGKIEAGKVAITSGFGLKSKYIIHTVVPVGNEEKCISKKLLKDCYKNALELAKVTKCTTVALPLLTIENDETSKEDAFNFALETIREWLNNLRLGEEMVIYIVLNDKKSLYLAPSLLGEVEKYVLDNYIEQSDVEEKITGRLKLNDYSCKIGVASFEKVLDKNIVKLKPPYLPTGNIVIPETATFSEKVREIIQKKDLTDPIVYKRINMQRQSFNRIINDKNACPRKRTALAIAIGLELNIEETKDLLWRAGFALTNCSLLDVIVKSFIQISCYDIIKINIALEYHEQQTLP